MLSQTVIAWTDRWQAYGTVYGAVATFVAVVVALVSSYLASKSAKDAALEQERSIRNQDRREFLLNLLFRVQDAAAQLTGAPREIKTGPSGQKLKGLLAAIPSAELPITRFCFGDGGAEQRSAWEAHASRLGAAKSPDWSMVMPEIGELIGRVSGAESMAEWS